MITVHNIQTGTHEYPDVDALVLSQCEWYDEYEGECDCHVSMNEKVIMLSYTHYGFNDGDTSAVIIISDLPDVVDPVDLYEQLVSCS